MLQVYVLDVSSISYGCCIQAFHVARVSCCSESQGARGVMVARHGRRGMGRGDLRADGRGALDARGQGAWPAWVLWMGACSSSSWLLGPARAEREERVARKEPRAQQ